MYYLFPFVNGFLVGAILNVNSIYMNNPMFYLIAIPALIFISYLTVWIFNND